MNQNNLIWLVSILIAGVALSFRFGPDKPKDVVHTKTVTVTTVRQSPPEPSLRDCVGCMTALEFDTIHAGMTWDALDAQFGDPTGNILNDHKEFYPAVGGGTYWVFLDKNDHVTGKEFKGADS
jgi:hypothetical protein